jgi:hypothetical protein
VPTISTTRPDALTGKIRSAVAALARDLGPDELTLCLARQDVLPVELTVQHSVAFAVAIAEGKGPLPGMVGASGSMAHLRAELDQRLEAVRQEATDLLEAWLAEHAKTYTSVLPPERCMRDRPLLGVQDVCGDCQGRTELTCDGCRGRGRVTCRSCGGRGRVTCSGCGGSRATRCMSCGGSGTHEVREFELSYTDRQNTMNQQNQMTRRVPCPGCGGRGNNPCGACGDGTQACTCMGGEVTCGGCGGRGVVPCARCAATGAIHHTGRIQCTVHRGIRVEVVDNGEEDRQTLRERVRFEDVGVMASETGGVRLERSSRVGHQVTLQYAASIPLECAEATVRGRALTIRAYGAGRDVFDHHDLVGTLLEPDLANLEASLRAHPLFTLTPGSSSARVTRRFLASEVNALIAEAAPQIAHDGAAPARGVGIGRIVGQALLLAPAIRRFGRAGLAMKLLMGFAAVGLLFSPQLVLSYLVVASVCFFYERRYQRALPAQLVAPTPGAETSAATSGRAVASLQAAVAAGMVNADYVRRASAAIGRAVPRLYRPLMIPPALCVAGALIPLFMLARHTLFRWSMEEKALVLLLLTGAAWFLLERRASASLEAMLGPALYARLRGRFGRIRTRYRLAAAAGFLLVWFLADFSVDLVGHLRYGLPLFP